MSNNSPLFSKDSELSPRILYRLLDGHVPEGWESDYKKIINFADVYPGSFFHTIMSRGISAVKQGLQAKKIGESKNENKNLYYFSMEHKSRLSKSLSAAGWRQVNCTVRLPQVDGIKAKKTHYAVHMWVYENDVILVKVKIENKFIPTNYADPHPLLKVVE